MSDVLHLVLIRKMRDCFESSHFSGAGFTAPRQSTGMRKRERFAWDQRLPLLAIARTPSNTSPDVPKELCQPIRDTSPHHRITQSTIPTYFVTLPGLRYLQEPLLPPKLLVRSSTLTVCASVDSKALEPNICGILTQTPFPGTTVARRDTRIHSLSVKCRGPFEDKDELFFHVSSSHRYKPTTLSRVLRPSSSILDRALRNPFTGTMNPHQKNKIDISVRHVLSKFIESH